MTSADIDIGELRKWVGRTDSADEVVSPALVRRFKATFGWPTDGIGPGDPAPLALHWCLAPMVAPPAETGLDGHALRGKFLPPVALPRRMWAGGEISFHRPLTVGDRVERRSRIADVELKTGRSGRLCFVAVEHVFWTEAGPAISERQDLVFRDPPDGAAPARPIAEEPPAETWSGMLHADAVALFRYSALTFNGHRIHYDYRYALEEGYADLVVHGPYQATLLLDFAARLRSSPPRRFSFRGVQPLLTPQGFRLAASAVENGLDLLVVADGGAVTMRAEAEW